MSDSLPSPSDSTPPKKRAAKKAAAKKVAASAEAPAPAAKKAAKKATTKVAKKAVAASPHEAPAPASPKKRAAKKAVVVTAPEPVSEKVKVARPKKATAETATSAVASVVVATPAPIAIPTPPPTPVTTPAPFPHPRPQQHPGQPQRQHPNDYKKNKFGKNKKNGFDRHPKQNNKNFGHSQGPQKFDPDAERNQAILEGPKTEVEGLLELTPKGSGFLRSLKKSFEMAKDDAFVGTTLINKWGLRSGAVIKALTQMGPRGPQVVEVIAVNDSPPEEARRLPHFDELTAVNPSKRIPFENDQNRFTTRVLDIIAPVGRGQRGLIVSPPRSGKTTLMLHIAESVRQREDDSLHLIILLVDERPEEVTEFRRALPGAEIFASSNDEHPRNHCRIAELTIERAKRLVEAGKHVFLLMDSITRLARAYNNTGSTQGRGIGSGGVTVGALEAPRRLFAAARNTRGAGSLTILATALIQTNSRADEAIFQEFKGTGNMEIVLDRKIAENYIYPAVDIFKSGTRREELLLPEHMLHKIHLIRRGLSGHKPLEAMERLTYFLKKFPSNAQMLLEIKG
jgi:transcription termination factor Rho